ncbi:MAG: CCA tRNA nucleotidyltransferase [Silvanigrellaceae bacterium]|nr:CCA tRNA nucleotidyltransferase [Silvanigrellaceae bacterium]
MYKAVIKLCATLHKNRFQAYIVGGAVRELLISPKTMPFEFDIATNALPHELQKIFSSGESVGQVFAVTLVKYKGFTFEISTFRKEGAYSDRRHPDYVEKGTLYQDSCRRDFTINALFYDPCKKKVYDFHGGLFDLKNKIIRCVGDPWQRLYEDSLRIIRMFRFATNLNFQIHNLTLKAALQTKDGIKSLSKERILLEFEKVLPGKFPLLFYFISQYLHFDCFFAQTTFLDNSLKINSFQRKISPFFHKSYPFFSFIYLYIYLLQKQNKFDGKLFLEKQFWPLKKKEKKLLEVFQKILNFSCFFEQKKQENINYIIFYLIAKKLIFTYQKPSLSYLF